MYFNKLITMVQNKFAEIIILEFTSFRISVFTQTHDVAIYCRVPLTNLNVFFFKFLSIF